MAIIKPIGGGTIFDGGGGSTVSTYFSVSFSQKGTSNAIYQYKSNEDRWYIYSYGEWTPQSDGGRFRVGSGIEVLKAVSITIYSTNGTQLGYFTFDSTALNSASNILFSFGSYGDNKATSSGTQTLEVNLDSDIASSYYHKEGDSSVSYSDLRDTYNVHRISVPKIQVMAMSVLRVTSNVTALPNQYVGRAFNKGAGFKAFAVYGYKSDEFYGLPYEEVSNVEINSYSLSSQLIGDVFSSDYSSSEYNKSDVITVSYEGKSLELPVEKIHGLSSISINPSTGFALKGSAYTPSPTVTANYSDGTTKDVTSVATIDAINTSTLGDKTATVSYTDSEMSMTKTATFTATVQDFDTYYGFSGIKYEVKTGETIKTSYLEGERVDISSVVVYKTFSSGNDVEISLAEVTVTPSYATSDTTSIKLSYAGKETSITGIDVLSLDSISLEGNETNFFDGHEFDDDKGTITATAYWNHSNGTAQATTDVSSLITLSKTGEKLSTSDTSVTATYSYTPDNGTKYEKTVTYSITVTPVVIDIFTEITLDKTFYTNYTDFNINGISIKTKNNDGTVGKTLTQDDIRYDLPQEVINNGNKFVNATNTTVTIYYGTVSGTFTPTVIESEISEISVEKTPSTTFYILDKFNANGLSITAKYNNGKEEEISYSEGGNISVSGLSGTLTKDDLGEKTITVTYSGKETTYTVNVLTPDIESVTLSPINFEYKYGSELDTLISDINNATAIIKYENGKDSEVEYGDNLYLNIGESQTLDNFLTSILSDKNAGSTVSIFFTVTSPETNEVKNLVYSSILIQGTGKITSLIIEKNSNAPEYYPTGITIRDILKNYSGYVKIEGVDNSNYLSQPISIVGNSQFTCRQPLDEVVKQFNNDYRIQLSYSNGNDTATKEISVRIVPSWNRTPEPEMKLVVVEQTTLEYNGDDISTQAKSADEIIYALYKEDETVINESGKRVIKPDISTSAKGYVIIGEENDDGVIVKENDEYKFAKVVLFDDYIPVIGGQSNITVTFPHYVEGYADRINHCSFGIIYGYNNSRNRLFVSGNRDVGMNNMDWRSSPATSSSDGNNEQLSFGYFSDLDYCGYGQTSNSVASYNLLSNGKLLVLKTDSNQEPTIYFRNAVMAQAMSSDGAMVYDANGSEMMEEQYPLETGNIGNGSLSNFGIATLNGDTVFISKNGVMGMDSSNVIKDDSKYSSTRSKYIDRALREYDLSNAQLYTYNNYLLLIIGDGTVFVANSDYVENKQYEWWVFNNIKARTLFTYQNELYFGTDDGRICKFDFEDTYTNYNDTEIVKIGYGGIALLEQDKITINESTDKLIINNEYKNVIEEGMPIKITSKVSTSNEEHKNHVYAQIGYVYNQNTANNLGISEDRYIAVIPSVNGTSANYFKLTGDIDKRMYYKDILVEGRKVFIDDFDVNLPSTTNIIGREYTVTLKIDDDDLDMFCFTLKREDGSYVTPSLINRLRISYRIDENTTIHNIQSSIVDNVNVTTFQLKTQFNTTADIIRYDNQDMTAFKATLEKKNRFECRFITKPFYFNNMDRKKSIHSWNFVNDTKLASSLIVGYKTANTNSRYVLDSRASNTMSLTEFRLNAMSMLGDILPKIYTKHKLLPLVDFISFIFTNDNDSNCVINNLNVIYTLGMARIGD